MSVLVPEPFAAMQLDRSTVRVDGTVIHDCKRALILAQAARVRDEAHELQLRAATTREVLFGVRSRQKVSARPGG
jgi:hypothetical protein